ncbi:dTMP kinase [Pengzhenrongella frigida]|uniref:Thymidylate kinase n=1 Tax=Pengzhenrongella frigida TaxID=1259133 RepID=A0A4Q5N044_9MICO|nr:dTMP kinase [Cellulomonas sp. HLT2-17]RYV51502.1 dTMP kinase [Cellulomonas sp. HLT2-17]
MSPQSSPGFFLSFEGGEGVGKSTQAALLGEWLHDALGREVVLTREPGGTTLGIELRNAVLHGEDVDPRTEALLYATDRAHHVYSLVRPALERGAVVITDRYLDSSVAYQGNGRDLGADEVEQLSLWATESLLPELTVLLDLDPLIGLTRLTGDPDRLERAGDEFHRRIRQAFLDRAAGDRDRWLVVDASRTVDEIQADIRRRVAEALGHESTALGRPASAVPAASRAAARPAEGGSHR